MLCFVQDEVAVNKEEQCYVSLTETQTKGALHFSKVAITKTKGGKCFLPFAKAQTKEDFYFTKEEMERTKDGKYAASFAGLSLQKGSGCVSGGWGK